MALTKVGPAGIGSTPGTGYVIGDSFLHSTGLNATNAYYTGIVTSQNIRVLGDLQVDGTTTTLDTVVTSVDRLEVAANNATVGVAITQSGTGDILNLYDGSTEVFTVVDGGHIGVGKVPGDSNSFTKALDVNGPSGSAVYVRTNASNTNFGLVGHYGTTFYLRNQANGRMQFDTNGIERMRLTSDGNFGVGVGTPFGKLHVKAGTDANFSFSTGGGESSLEILNDAGSSNVPLNIRASEYKIKIQGTEKVRIDSSGNIGVGVGTPNFSSFGSNTGGLEISDVNTNNALLVQSGTNEFYFANTSSANYIWGDDNVPLTIATNDTERLRITAAGNVGINKTAPADRLHVGGKIRFGNNNTYYGVIEHEEGVTGANIYTSNDSGGHIFKRNATTQVTINANGYLGIGTHNPSKELDVAGQVLFKHGSSALMFQESNNGAYLWLDGANGDFTGGDYFHVAATDNQLMTFGYAGGDKLSLTAVGNMGLGTISPNNYSNWTTLTINGTNGGEIDFERNGTLSADIFSGSSGFYFTTREESNRPIVWQLHNGTSYGERMRLTGDGKLGIGENAPIALLHVNYTGTQTTSSFKDASHIRLDGTGAADALSGIGFGYSNSGGDGNYPSAWMGIKVSSWTAYVKHDLIFATRSVDTNSEPTESLRINANGNVTIGGKSNPNWASTVDALTVGYAGVLYEDSYTSGTDNYVILGNNTFYDASGGGNTYIRNDEAQRIMMQSGNWWFQNAPSGTAGNAITFTDRFRITSGGKVGININPTRNLDVYSTGSTTIRIQATGTTTYGQIEWIHDSGSSTWIWKQGSAQSAYAGVDSWNFYNPHSSPIAFYTGTVSRMQIDGAGDVIVASSAAPTSRAKFDVRARSGHPAFNITHADDSFYRSLGTVGPLDSAGNNSSSGGGYLHVRLRTIWNDASMTMFRATGYYSYSAYAESYAGCYRYNNNSYRNNPYGQLISNQGNKAALHSMYNEAANPGYLVLVFDWGTNYTGLLIEHIGAGSNYASYMQHDLEIIDSKRSTGTSPLVF